MKNLFFLFLLIVIQSTGQNQANIWYFGNGAGLDFNNGCNPTVLTDGKIDGFEGCATIADKTTGQLLFYTNSDSVWNRNHVVMPNGHLVFNGSTITQVMIIAKPNSDSLFYIITSDVQSTGAGLQFHQVDMSLNGGLGGLTFKDSLLYSLPVTEKITAVRHSNGTDIWLIAHEWNSNKYLSFLVTSSGISTSPVVSSVGKVHFDASTTDAIGEIKVSPNGTKLAAVTLTHPNIELFDFNNSTGQISNPITMPENGGYNSQGNPSGLYGLSFSSNSSMLYVSQWLFPTANITGKIIQYDISSNDSTITTNSRVDIFTSASKSLYSLQLAPNRKIYVGQNTPSNYIGVINSPDSAGMNCNYVDNGVFLNGKHSSWGLNNLMEYGNYCEPTGFIENEKETAALNIYPNPINGNESFLINFPESTTENQLEIYSVNGQLVFSQQIAKGETSVVIPGALLFSGLYVVKMQGENSFSVEKLVVE